MARDGSVPPPLPGMRTGAWNPGAAETAAESVAGTIAAAPATSAMTETSKLRFTIISSSQRERFPGTRAGRTYTQVTGGKTESAGCIGAWGRSHPAGPDGTVLHPVPGPAPGGGSGPPN